MKNILTAIGNPKINENLKKDKRLNILEKDILYKEGILEWIEINKKINIDYIIINYDLFGEIDIELLIKKINKLNKNIKIILIDENNKFNNKENKYKIITEINEQKIIKIIFLNNEKILNNPEILFNTKIEKNKIINIFGNKGVGKSIFSILLAKELAKLNLKILIIDTDRVNRSIFEILNKKENDNEIKINNFYITTKKIKNIDLKKYDFIIIDNNNFNLLKTKDFIINSINIFISESNILGIKKLNNLLKKYTKEINKKNINIIFNKYNIYSISLDILKNTFNNYNILGKINLNKKIDLIINTHKLININEIKIDILKIKNKIVKE